MPIRTTLPRNLLRSAPTLLLAISVLALLAFELWRSYAITRDEAERNVQNLAHVLSEQTARTIQAIDLTLQGIVAELANRPDLPDNDPAFLANLQRRLSSLPYARALFIIGEDGFILHDTDYPLTPRVSLADRDYFVAHRENSSLGLHVGPPLLSRSVGVWFVSLSRRIERADGSFGGIVVAAMEPLYFEEFYRQLWVGNGTIAMFLRDGTLLARSPRGTQLIGVSFASAEPFSSLLPESAGDVYWDRSPIDHINRVAGYRALQNVPLVMQVAMDEAQVMQPWRSYAVVATSGAAILLAMLLAMEWLSRRYRYREERARARLAEAERLESIGRFAGGVAHDLGNLLRIVRSAVLLLRPQTANLPEATEVLDRLDESLTTGREMVLQLLAHSRNQPLELRIGDMNKLVTDAMPMLRQAAGPKVEVLASVSHEQALCLINCVQLRAVLLNLILNARDAMPHGGKVSIEVRSEQEDGRIRWVEVSVCDEGDGMPEAVLKQAFDPFFTTKGPGVGSGLGLSQVRAFVERCNGQVAITSKENEGTAICLRFPLVENDSNPIELPPSGRLRT